MRSLFTLITMCVLLSTHAQILNTIKYDTTNSGIPDNSVVKIDITSNDVLWIQLWSTGMVSFNGTTWTPYNVSTPNFPSNTIDDFTIDNNDNVYVCDWTDVAKFNGTSWSDIDPPTVYNGVMTEEQATGTVWIADDNGIQEYTGSGWSSQIPGPSSSAFSPTDMVIASNGDIWTTSIGDSYVAKYSQAASAWTVYDTNNVSIFDKQWWYSTIGLTHDNKVVIGGSAVKSLIFDGVSWQDLDTYSGQSMSVFSDAVVKNNVTWLGMCNGFGLASYDGSSWKKYTTNPSYIPIVGVRFDTQGYLWMGALDGLYKVSTNNLDVNDAEGLNDVALLYPNPSQGNITLRFLSGSFSNAHAVVYDITGAEVFSVELKQPDNQLNLSHLPAGVYSLNMRTENGSYFQKIILQ